MSKRVPILLAISADLQPRSAAHESLIAAEVNCFTEALRMLGCDVIVTTDATATLRTITIEAGNLAHINSCKQVA